MMRNFHLLDFDLTKLLVSVYLQGFCDAVAVSGPASKDDVVTEYQI